MNTDRLVNFVKNIIKKVHFFKATSFAILLLSLSFSARAIIPVNEPFVAAFNDPAWQLYGTAAFNTGWLRLTSATTNQTGAAILTDPFPTSTQIVVTFDYAMYGGTGADGLVFFTFDGSVVSGPGDFGGCLGYCSRALAVQNPRIPGVLSAYFGVAFDLYGNMSDGTHAPTGGPGVRPANVLIKGQGPADGLSGGYQYLSGAAMAGMGATRAASNRIRILLINNVITVQRQVAGVFTNLLPPYDLSAGAFPQTLPPTLKLGFAAGTGGSTNIHELHNLTVDFPSDLVLTKTGSANVAAGGPISYTLTTTNSGPYAVNGGVITDTIPASITGVTWTCAASGGAVCVTGNGSGNTLSETINIPVGGQITMTVAGTVNPATTIGTVISNTANVALPAGLADPVAANNTSTFNTTVNGAAVTIAATTNGAEPGTNGQFTVSIAQPVPQPVTVNYTVTGTATAGSDYTTLFGSVVIPANTLSAPIPVPVLDDLVLEPTETVIVTLNSVSSTFAGTLVVGAAPGNQATISIFDNEKTVSMAAPDAAGDVAGNTGTVVVTVLDNLGAPAVGVTVSLAVTGSATLSSYLGVTDANGQVTVLVSDTTIEVVNVTASYDSNGDNTPDKAVVTGSPAAITFTAGPGGAGPIHAWHLEDVSWAAANSVVDYIGAWVGTPTDAPVNPTGASPALTAIAGQGTCGYGVFDGVNDNVEIGQPAQDITTSLTLAAWVRTVNTGGVRYAIARGLDNQGGTANDREIYLGLNGANFSAGSRGAATITRADSAAAAPLNTWVHLAATATITSPTQATWRLYVNGVLSATTVGAVWPVIATTAYWSIGGSSNNNTGGNISNWNGNIDEVQIYNYALTQPQVAAIMSQRHSCPGPNLTVIKTVAVTSNPAGVTGIAKSIPGATLRYTITLQNSSGVYSSDAVVVTDNFDDTHLTYVPGSVNVSNASPAVVSDAGGVPAKPDRIVVNSANIPAGGTVTVTFDVKVD